MTKRNDNIDRLCVITLLTWVTNTLKWSHGQSKASNTRGKFTSCCAACEHSLTNRPLHLVNTSPNTEGFVKSSHQTSQRIPDMGRWTLHIQCSEHLAPVLALDFRKQPLQRCYPFTLTSWVTSGSGSFHINAAHVHCPPRSSVLPHLFYSLYRFSLLDASHFNIMLSCHYHGNYHYYTKLY